jgi:hypothetical protein
VLFGGGCWLGIKRLSVPIQKEKISRPDSSGFEMTGKGHALSRVRSDLQVKESEIIFLCIVLFFC